MLIETRREIRKEIDKSKKELLEKFDKMKKIQVYFL